jgi:succinoglycan biosynthesis protein ExoA
MEGADHSDPTQARADAPVPGAALRDGTWPDVDVVIPVRNEAGTLRDAVDAVLAQDYPGTVRVTVAVAPSTDGTEAVAAALTGDDRVRTVVNPVGTTPAGLNAAIAAGSAGVVVRVDGHAELSPGYIRRAVATMRRTGAANVGGIQKAVGLTPFERAVAAAMTSRFGTGDAAFHYGGAEGPTDTVYLGVFDRGALEAAGRFDEQLVRNQDYELNIRLRRDGGIVWFDPELEVTYRPRGTLRALAKQYFDYGRWKRVVLTRHPGSLRWRQAVPPATTVAVAIGAIAGLWWRPALVVPALYAVAVLVASATTRVPVGTKARLVAVFPTMHLTWGAGFLLGRGRRR